jgi:hypothetical protein
VVLQYWIIGKSKQHICITPLKSLEEGFKKDSWSYLIFASVCKNETTAVYIYTCWLYEALTQQNFHEAAACVTLGYEQLC